MDILAIRRCGAGRAATVAILAGMLGACADQSIPAPVFLKGGEVVAAPAPALRQVTIRHDQSVDSVARYYHVPASAIIAANGLRPPYAVKAGARLSIPDSNPPPVRQATGYSAPAPRVAAATPLPPPHPETIAVPQRPGTAVPPPAVSTQAMPSSQQAAAAPPASQQTLTPPQAVKATPTVIPPTVIPLDGPPPPKQASALPAGTLTPPSAAPSPAAASQARGVVAALPPGSNASIDWGSAETAQATGGGRFPWPVRGRVLANYGGIAGGGHNDGINIAAARGTPVRAIDAGTVAYAGNEMKGYGNLVLIKHANGWISAYAHLDALEVKPGDRITAGQAFARVGDSGGVTQPQLHFELRRGSKPVDPKEFLAPAPSAAAAGNTAG
jgi:murein DD-endopeptidase MepM/ murein hydrolase activator NlpD